MIRKKGTIPTPTTTTLPRLFLLLLYIILSAFNCTLGLISGFVGQYFNQRPVFIACVCMRTDPAMITKKGINKAFDPAMIGRTTGDVPATLAMPAFCLLFISIFSGSFQTSFPFTFGIGFIIFFITQHHSLSLILIMVDIYSHHLSFTFILVVVADSFPAFDAPTSGDFPATAASYNGSWPSFSSSSTTTMEVFNKGCALIDGHFSHHYLDLFFLVVGLVSGLAYAEPCGSFAFTLSFSYYLFLFIFLFLFLFLFNFILAFGLSSGVFRYWMHVLFYFYFFFVALGQGLFFVAGAGMHVLFYFLFLFLFLFLFWFYFVFILFLFCFVGGLFGRFVALISFWLWLEWNVDLLNWSFIYNCFIYISWKEGSMLIMFHFIFYFFYYYFFCLWYWKKSSHWPDVVFHFWPVIEVLWTWLLFRGWIEHYTMYWNMERELDMIEFEYCFLQKMCAPLPFHRAVAQSLSNYPRFCILVLSVLFVW